MNRIERVALVLSSALLSSLSLFGQATAVGNQNMTRELPDLDVNRVRYQQFDKNPLKFSSHAYYVLVPVIVRDKSGKHVTGLTKDAFQLFENGKQQKVASVEEMSQGDATPVKHSRENPHEFSNEFGTTPAGKRVTVIALDMINTAVFDQGWARQAAIRYLASSVTSDSLLELVTMDRNGFHVVHDFTSDPEILVEALKKTKSTFDAMQAVDRDQVLQGTSSATTLPQTTTGGAHMVSGTGLVDVETTALVGMARGEKMYGDFQQGLAVGNTLECFHQLAQQLSALPGRKSVVWITGGFPFYLDATNGAISEGSPRQAYEHTMQLLNSANIALYPVDARGLVVAGQFDATSHLGHQGIAAQPSELNRMSGTNEDRLATMRTFAAMTGGKAYVNTNELTGAIRDAVNDGAAFYMLSYAVDTSNTRQGWRKLKVKVAGDYHVRAREGLYVTQSMIDPNVSAQLDLYNALNSPLDYTGLPLHLNLSDPAGDGATRKVGFTLLVPPKVATIDAADNNHLNLDVMYVVRNAKGEQVAQRTALQCEPECHHGSAVGEQWRRTVREL